MSQCEWRPVPDFPDYEVSSEGEIRRVKDYPNLPKGRLVKGSPSKDDGRLIVRLYRDGKQYSQRISRIVCRAFNGEPPSKKHHAAHDDGDVTNNKATNLFWKTPKENEADKIRHGRTNNGQRNGAAKLTEDQARSILLASGNSKEIAKRFGVCYATVWLIKTGRKWKHLREGQ